MPTDKFVTIASYTGPWEAHLAHAKLESEGIFSIVLDDQIASINWFYSNAVGGVRLQVSAADAERSVRILRETSEEPTNLQDSASQEDRPPSCPSCGSSNLRRERFSLPAALLSFLLLGIPFLFNRKRLVCLNCGSTWKMKDLS